MVYKIMQKILSREMCSLSAITIHNIMLYVPYHHIIINDVTPLNSGAFIFALIKFLKCMYVSVCIVVYMVMYLCPSFTLYNVQISERILGLHKNCRPSTKKKKRKKKRKDLYE